MRQNLTWTFILKRTINKEPNISDQVLIESYKATGNLNDLGILYMRYSHLILGICMKYLKEPAKAQDSSMDIFEKLVIKLKEHEVTHFKSWLYRLTTNHCLSQLRIDKKHKIQTAIPETGIKDPTSFLSALATLKEAKLEILESSLEQLKEKQKICLTLFYFESKSYDQISVIINEERKSVKSHIQNAKRNLKNILEKHHVFKQ